jgi:hypothetical protein
MAQTPTVGRIVLYRGNDEKSRAAIIIDVYEGEQQMINCFAFAMHGSGPAGSVTYDENLARPNTWCWPPRAGSSPASQSTAGAAGAAGGVGGSAA